MGSGQPLIGGPDKVVQIDECLVGRRKYNRGRAVEGTWVLGMIETRGEVRMEVVKDRSGPTLEGVITRHVAPGTMIHTDGWRGYSRLDRLGYGHKKVNHSEEFVAIDGTHTQAIESQWRQLRRKFSRGGIRHEDITTHLIEYEWRRYCKTRKLDTFAEIMKYLRYDLFEKG